MILGRDYPAGRKAAGCPSPFDHSFGVHTTVWTWKRLFQDEYESRLARALEELRGSLLSLLANTKEQIRVDFSIFEHWCVNVDDLDNCLIFGMFYVSCVGVYDNQMDRSRQEFAAMYDVRVKINPKICKLIRTPKYVSTPA